MSAGYEYSETSYSYNQMLNKMFLNPFESVSCLKMTLYDVMLG